MPKLSNTEKMMLGSFCFHAVSVSVPLRSITNTGSSWTPWRRELEALIAQSSQRLQGKRKSHSRGSLGSAATARARQGPQPCECHPAMPLPEVPHGQRDGHRELWAQELIPALHPGVPWGCYTLETPGTAEGACAHWVYVPSHTHRMFRAVQCPCTANTPDPVT